MNSTSVPDSTYSKEYIEKLCAPSPSFHHDSIRQANVALGINLLRAVVADSQILVYCKKVEICKDFSQVLRHHTHMVSHPEHIYGLDNFHIVFLGGNRIAKTQQDITQEDCFREYAKSRCNVTIWNIQDWR